jgi:hypothetical protein
VVALKHGIRQERLFPAYHGEIAIDPVTGAVLRISLLGSALRSQYIMESAITVDYGSVALGGNYAQFPIMRSVWGVCPLYLLAPTKRCA